jgi:hypothetical protein
MGPDDARLSPRTQSKQRDTSGPLSRSAALTFATKAAPRPSDTAAGSARARLAPSERSSAAAASEALAAALAAVWVDSAGGSASATAERTAGPTEACGAAGGEGTEGLSRPRQNRGREGWEVNQAREGGKVGGSACQACGEGVQQRRGVEVESLAAMARRCGQAGARQAGHVARPRGGWQLGLHLHSGSGGGDGLGHTLRQVLADGAHGLAGGERVDGSGTRGAAVSSARFWLSCLSRTQPRALCARKRRSGVRRTARTTVTARCSSAASRRRSSVARLATASAARSAAPSAALVAARAARCDSARRARTSRCPAATCATATPRRGPRQARACAWLASAPDIPCGCAADMRRTRTCVRSSC